MRGWLWIALFLAIAVCAVLLEGCGMGSIHPGEKARIDVSGATGCDTEESFNKLYIYISKDKDIERANRELRYTGRCIALQKNEVVNVVKESGELRKIQRPDGTEVWTSWTWLRFVG